MAWKLLLLVGLCVGAASAGGETDRFAAWATAHDKEYGSPAEEAAARRAFASAEAAVAAAPPGEVRELNAFAGVPVADFLRTHAGFVADAAPAPPRAEDVHVVLGASPPPPRVDWRARGTVTSVKNQGHCGACWAFSAVGAVEGINAIRSGQLRDGSTQELIDCDAADSGCSGGSMRLAYSWVRKNGGLDTWADYKFTGKQGTCDAPNKPDMLTIDGEKVIPFKDEAALRDAVAQQPVSVAIAVTQELMVYKGGVFNDSSCDGLGLNHGVLVVGYDTAGPEPPHWIVKNSWGASWGESGYFRLAMGSNKCGVADQASYPTRASSAPGPPMPPPWPAAPPVGNCDWHGDWTKSDCCIADAPEGIAGVSCVSWRLAASVAAMCLLGALLGSCCCPRRPRRRVVREAVGLLGGGPAYTAYQTAYRPVVGRPVDEVVWQQRAREPLLVPE